MNKRVGTLSRMKIVVSIRIQAARTAAGIREEVMTGKGATLKGTEEKEIPEQVRVTATNMNKKGKIKISNKSVWYLRQSPRSRYMQEPPFNISQSLIITTILPLHS
jgi:hypothetical protein